jgi:hypothetical protein
MTSLAICLPHERHVNSMPWRVVIVFCVRLAYTARTVSVHTNLKRSELMRFEIFQFVLG